MNTFQKVAQRAALATALTAGAVTGASAGCFGMEAEQGLSEIANVQLAGLSAMRSHARNSTYNDVRRYQTHDFNLSNGQTIEVEGSFSGHSYASAVRKCESYHGETQSYREGLFGTGEVFARVTADYSALTCDGDEAYVVTPNNQVFVVPSRGTPTPVSGGIQCRR